MSSLLRANWDRRAGGKMARQQAQESIGMHAHPKIYYSSAGILLGKVFISHLIFTEFNLGMVCKLKNIDDFFQVFIQYIIPCYLNGYIACGSS
jgi:hypothetical protein